MYDQQKTHSPFDEWVNLKKQKINYFVSAGFASAVFLSLQQDLDSFLSPEQDFPSAPAFSLQQDLASFLESFLPLSLSSKLVDAETLPTNPAKANIKNTFFMVWLG
jgi:hypothetical protein